MKRTIICSIPMREQVESVVYTSEDKSLPVSEKPFRYPISAFLTQTLAQGDELKVVLLVKMDNNPFYKKNTDGFVNEMNEICEKMGANAEYVTISTSFSQERTTHELLMGKLVDEIDTGSHILVDMTYGPKDLPIVIFAALSFAEKFLGCEIDNIVYGKAEFKDNKVVRSQICDMIPLYCLSSVAGTIRCDDADKARQMLKSLLSI